MSDPGRPWCPASVGERGPRDPALITSQGSWSRGQLLAAADRVAAGLPGNGPVAVHATRCAATVVAVLAGLRAGVAVVPVPPDAGPGPRRHLLSDSGSRMLLVPAGSAVPEGTDGLPVRVVDPLGTATASFSPSAYDADRTALVLYTSGTTGPPKGAVLPARAVLACLDGLAEAWSWTSKDVLAHGLPLFHAHGLVLGVLGGLRTGSPVVLTDAPTPAGYADAVTRHRASMLFAVPTIWSRIAADRVAAQALRDCRLLVSGSAALPSTVADELRRLTGQVPTERYGMTETLITLAAPAGAARRTGSVGPPITGVRARLVAEDGTPVAADGESLGELQLCGATLFDGYLEPGGARRPLTGDGWFATGDIASCDPDGWYRILGRRSTDLIKSGGYRIGAGEIETSLLAHPAVAEAAVVGVADDDLGQRIVAYVVPAGQAAGQALIEHVAGDLGSHKRPREIRFVAGLPRNEMGKVVKTALQRPRTAAGPQ